MLISLFADERTLTALLCTGPPSITSEKKTTTIGHLRPLIKEVNSR